MDLPLLKNDITNILEPQKPVKQVSKPSVDQFIEHIVRLYEQETPNRREGRLGQYILKVGSLGPCWLAGQFWIKKRQD